MLFQFRKLLYTIILNFSFFLILMTAIQNSSNKTRVNFLKNQTVRLPISFIIGSSFIGGSVIGSFFTLNFKNKK